MARKWTKIEKLRLAGLVNPQEAASYITLPINRIDLPQNHDGRRELINCIYDTLLVKEIKYTPEIYNWLEQQQSIRIPKEILESPKEGTCLDLSVLFCGICLANELLPLLIMIEGHAFAAVSLNHGLRGWNDFSRNESFLFEENGFTENSDEIARLINNGDYLAVECTGFAESENIDPSNPEGKNRDKGILTFDRAIEAGREQLSLASRPFEYALDIAITQFSKGIEIIPPETDTKLNPFKLLKPYTANESKIFFGRETEIKNVTESLETNNCIFISGAAGIGKTSIINAGVIKKILANNGERKIIQVSDYSVPLDNFSKAFANSEGRKIIYILDQFEDIFEPAVDKAKRTNFLDKLIEFQESSQVKFIIATNRYEDVQPYFKTLKHVKIDVGLLDEIEAREVVLRSLEKNRFDLTRESHITKLVLPELARQSIEAKDFDQEKGIYPPLLQIVFYTLTETAHSDFDDVIGEKLFDNYYKSAEIILKNYIEEKLKNKFSDNTEFEHLIQILDSIQINGNNQWFSANDLVKEDKSELLKTESILEKLSFINLLKKSLGENENLYSLAGPWVFILIDLIADEKLKYQSLARIEMRSAWKAWIVSNKLASADQIKNLSPYIKLLQLEPVELLFLLRSAVEHKLQVNPFLEAFNENEQLRRFAERLDNEPSELTGTNLQNTKLLLNYDGKLPISENALTNSFSGARQTSALLLTVLNDGSVYEQVSNAFNIIDNELSNHNVGGFKQIKSLSELRGIITEAYPDDSNKINRERLKYSKQFGIYSWLVQRKFKQNQTFIFSSLLYGGVISAIGLGLIWALFPAIKDISYKFDDPERDIIVEWGGRLIYGILLGLFLGPSLVFGFVSSVVFLNKSKKNTVNDFFQFAQINRKDWLFVIFCGAISFAIMHILLLLLMGDNPNTLLYDGFIGIILGLTGGIGYLVSQKSRDVFGNANWILGGVVSAILSTLIQYTLIQYTLAQNQIEPDDKHSYSIAWVYRYGDFTEFFDIPFAFWCMFKDYFPDWKIYFSCLCAFLFGLTLFMTIYGGIKLATKNNK